MNGQGDATGAGGIGVGVESGDDFEAFFLETMVAEQRGAEVSRADEDDRLQAFAAKRLADDRG